ncbi:hypothetical protein UAY_01166 [Enterococcus moraviensis ATCC BAA-383]|uniref:Uncharacterized protein n=1 Tax=Enterococcus moraviensis ATCC BAA-383 TaxID=1158609 RepID=R2T2V4_9ENTE|nr:hypothetical protein [Enterococcus moraviensis]EOI01758.1 hypothetical protein UAY_01166 [Enterococcus moraviensis ATCC BAA-383]EOT73707.1 hypothetical protein I586_00701 [Enterococcus moraviensis ATCC BAA-383]OJG69267.1 hypothetical protein RV09_GL000666 [Enterococcus moraviensis]
MNKFKNFMFSLTSLVGAISIFGGGVLFASLFVLFFIISVVLEAMSNRSKKQTVNL